MCLSVGYKKGVLLSSNINSKVTIKAANKHFNKKWQNMKKTFKFKMAALKLRKCFNIYPLTCLYCNSSTRNTLVRTRMQQEAGRKYLLTVKYCCVNASCAESHHALLPSSSICKNYNGKQAPTFKYHRNLKYFVFIWWLIQRQSVLLFFSRVYTSETVANCYLCQRGCVVDEVGLLFCLSVCWHQY